MILPPVRDAAAAAVPRSDRRRQGRAGRHAAAEAAAARSAPGGGPPGGRVRAARSSTSTGSGCAAGRYVALALVRPAADRDVRDGLHDRRHPQARRHPDQPGVDDPRQRRQRAREDRAAGGQPGRRRHRPDSGAGAQRGDGRRGPRLLHQPRVLVHRLPPGVQEQHLRRRPAGRLDDHPAVRQERARRRRPLRRRRAGPQGQGTRHLDQDVGRVVQGPGAAVLPQHHLLRPRCVRHRRGLAGVLRQARRAAQRRRGCAARGADPAAVGAGPGRRPRGFGRAVELGARRHGHDGRAVAQRPRGAGVPADGVAGPGRRAEPDHRTQRVDRTSGHQGTDGPVQHRRADVEHRGSAGHHDDRPEGAEVRRGRGGRVHGRARIRTCGRPSPRSTRRPAG